MYSLQELYRVGKGPSSSHTIGPSIAVNNFKNEYPKTTFFRITLYGSLAATGKGHFTDKAIITVVEPFEVEFIWKPETILPFHTNAMEVEGFINKKDKKATYKKIYYSVGGGAIVEDGNITCTKHKYPDNSMEEIIKRCTNNNIDFIQYINQYEDKSIWDFCAYIWNNMQDSIGRGLISEEKYLPSPILVERKAPLIYKTAKKELDIIIRNDALISAYALAVSEENASMGVVVTAPTCGSAGVLPAVLRYAQEQYNIPNEKIIKAIGVAGIIGLVAKHSASLSGAEVGCQGEIGVSTSMAAGAMCYLLNGTLRQIERAAEIAAEHSLGLTCDPIGGYVLIPCIERNANGALRAVHTASYAMVLSGSYRISYDAVLKTMYETGLDMSCDYKETSKKGLAKYYESMAKNDALKNSKC